MRERQWWRAVGPRIRELRTERGYSRLHLARHAGVTQASVSNYEAGKRQVSAELARRFASALEVPLAELLHVPQVVVMEPRSLLAEAVRALSADPEALRRVLGGGEP